jgi:hypothetical protein
MDQLKAFHPGGLPTPPQRHEQHHAYVQNVYAVLEDNEDNDEDLDDDVATVTTHLATMTTQSQLTAASMVANAASVTMAFNQLATNQTAMMQMMVYANTTRTNNQQRACAIAGAPPVQYPPAMAPPLVPPITQYNIPNFHQGSQGRGGWRQGGGCGGRRQGRHTLYNQGGGVSIPPFVPGPGQPGNAQNMAPAYSNIVKKFNNMNYCFFCGFDVKDWHTLKTCRYEKRRPHK